MTADPGKKVAAPTAAVEGECVEAGNDENGQARLIIYCTESAIKNGPAMVYRRVNVTLAASDAAIEAGK